MAVKTYQPLAMREEVRDMWIKAMLSGQYKKGMGKLHTLLKGKGDGGHRWCCLGVLCDLASKNGVNVTITEDSVSRDVIFRYNSKLDYLPDAVREWAGLEKGNPLVYGIPLAEHNDGYGHFPNGRRFSTIAAMIAGTYKGRV